MKKFFSFAKSLLLDIFFPRFCFNCGREGSYLCQDCQSILDITEYHYCLCKIPQRLPKPGKCKRCQSKNLNGLYFALSYESFLVKKLIKLFKYEPYIKDLSKTLSSLIITHFKLLNNKPDFSDFLLVPVPLAKKKLKMRGFNHAQELAKELSTSFKIPLINDVLIKTKETLSQVELSEKEREENIKNVFSCQNQKKIKRQKILLVDDIYTTGSTMEECARILKENGAKQVWGIAVARG